MQDAGLYVAVAAALTEEETSRFMGRVLLRNPHLRGAGADDVLSMWHDADAHLEATEPWFEEHGSWARAWARHPAHAAVLARRADGSSDDDLGINRAARLMAICVLAVTMSADGEGYGKQPSRSDVAALALKACGLVTA